MRAPEPTFKISEVYIQKINIISININIKYHFKIRYSIYLSKAKGSDFFNEWTDELVMYIMPFFGCLPTIFHIFIDTRQLVDPSRLFTG